MKYNTSLGWQYNYQIKVKIIKTVKISSPSLFKPNLSQQQHVVWGMAHMTVSKVIS